VANAGIKVSVAQLDYTDQFDKGLQLESGLKGTYTFSQSTAAIKPGQWAVGTCRGRYVERPGHPGTDRCRLCSAELETRQPD
jgi:hypothetical protein